MQTPTELPLIFSKSYASSDGSSFSVIFIVYSLIRYDHDEITHKSSAGLY